MADPYKANVLAGAAVCGDDDKDYRIGTLLDSRLFAWGRMYGVDSCKRINRGEIIMSHSREGRGSDLRDNLFIITKDGNWYGSVTGAPVQQVIAFSNRLSHKAFYDACVRILRSDGGDISKAAAKAFAYE